MTARFRCWGSNKFGPLDIAALPGGTSYTQVSVSTYEIDFQVYHTCAMRSDGMVACWGSNLSGQLNVPALPLGMTYTTVTAGTFHSCAARSDGAVICWGLAANGRATPPSTLDLLKQTQPIVFTPAVPNPAPLGQTFQLAPNVGSGAPVVLAVSTPSVCTISGTTLSFIVLGTCSFTADRAGDANCEPAPVRSSFVGPDVEELRSLAALGYQLGTLEAAMRLHSSGVTPEEIRAFAELGYGGLPVEQLIRAHNQSLSPELAREINAKAGRRLSFSELIAARRREEATSSSEPAPRAAAVESTTPLGRRLGSRELGQTGTPARHRVGWQEPVEALDRRERACRPAAHCSARWRRDRRTIPPRAGCGGLHVRGNVQLWPRTWPFPIRAQSLVRVDTAVARRSEH